MRAKQRVVSALIFVARADSRVFIGGALTASALPGLDDAASRIAEGLHGLLS